MSEQRYMYTVSPKRPVKGLSEVPILRVRKSLMLTKEDVKKCLQSGSVYRRFTPDCVERVTIANLDRFHNEKFMTETEYEAFLAGELGKDSGKVEIPTVPIVAPPVEDPVPAVDEPDQEPDGEPTDEVKDEEPDCEPEAPVEDAEESEEEAVVEVEPKKDFTPNYNNKKNKKR